MADYLRINCYSTRSGELAISRKVFEALANEATDRVLSNDVSKRKRFKLFSPIKVIFKKNNQVSIKVFISVKKGVKPQEVSLAIQKEIAHDLATYVESVPFDIEVSIAEIK